MKRSHVHFAVFGFMAIVAAVVILGSAQNTESNFVTIAQPSGRVKGAAAIASATVIVQDLPQPITEALDSLPTNGATALDLLTYAAQKNKLELKTKNYGEMGVLVEGIGSVINGTDNKYWSYYINGASGQVAADQYQVKTGDVVEFRFEKSNF